MIFDTTGTSTIDVIRENEIGIYDTTSYKTVQFCCRNSDGSYCIKVKDGHTFFTKPGTIVIEK
jgi:hypothetical protein